MSTQAAPVVPPRPARSPQPRSSLETPGIPPRPVSHRIDRSVSPMRNNYAPSPFNEWSGPSMTRTISNEIPQRPPSVTIPSLGEEGIEYADLNVANVPESHEHAAPKTRNVSSDLKIHAPRPSLPTSSAKAKVQVVTRTDSRQAAAAGLGRNSESSPALDESERISRTSHSRASGSRAESSTASSDRRLSAQLGEEHGFRVPMYPNAGDVQAPSPSPYLDQGSQRPGRNHHRTRSARDSSLPPGSYGLHGHGVQHADKFEKAWYEKHPDEYVKEEGQYGPGVGTPRPDWALSSDDLNKIVRSPGLSGPTKGASPAVIGTPEEEVGYLASDEYTHRMASPPPENRIESQPVVESPLRQMSFPASVTGSKEAPGSVLRHGRSSSHSHYADGDVIHVHDPKHPLHHPDGFAPSSAQNESTTDAEEALEEDAPILAADEVRPDSAFLHPAVSPTRGSFDEEYRSRTPSVSHTRSNSRSTSAQAAPMLTRYDSHDENHTPLENVEEYEPLFPEEETKKERPASTAERFRKRPDLSKHRFPSQDIWEDTPNSLQLHATVTTPDIPKAESPVTFETPDQEAIRRMKTDKINSHQVASHILGGETGRDKDFPKVPQRPDTIKQRFPSQDIWEDAPDSQQLVTTVEPAAEELKSPEVPAKPIIPVRPQKQPQSTSPTEKRQPPVIPGRPKPQIPSRPAKPSTHTSADRGVPASSETKEFGAEGPAVPKAKPSIPARPGGSKIAALKAGFLTDLNSRLQLGPQQPKPQEKEPEQVAEKQPLSDARKGRARGPARRKPAVENANARLPTIPEIKITETWNVWQVTQDGNLLVGDENKATKTLEPSIQPEPIMAPAIAKNIAGEPVDPTPESPVVAEVSSPDVDSAPVIETKPAEASPIEEAVSSIPEPTTQKEEPAVDAEQEELSTEATEVASEEVEAPSNKIEAELEEKTPSIDEKKTSDSELQDVGSSS
ncbi:uncharacterized protein N7483_009686 [Penicillium malachiteum]|uniref:uncharacterized protein n=1 Tax=Penicillium malachiteum TaxID=1324776 RepID=UPI002547E8A6|nr:uncharacterized protein N7483_009686 [Penicillium malachiteum]KAJ5721752.1 hypothetical protein N7483_009686 [Penicillium malachiteum]